jgi:hypothetical protein
MMNKLNKFKTNKVFLFRIMDLIIAMLNYELSEIMNMLCEIMNGPRE